MSFSYETSGTFRALCKIWLKHNCVNTLDISKNADLGMAWQGFDNLLWKGLLKVN
ncbi:hypothetical protein VV11_022215 [Trichodesmium erythraeum 21-75]|nr:hypothetical protein [Trichodesmium erythraeum 21-75]